jgi:hypothetical protein
MPTAERFLRLPMCPICRDQSYDFLLASGVQVLMAPVVGISGTQFTVQELLLFFALIFLKHRIAPPWERAR